MKTASRRWTSLGLAAVASAALVLLAPARAAFGHTDGLKDGTKVEIIGDRMFTYQYPNHSKTAVKTPAKDGTYTLKSGKTITVKDGKIVEKK